MNVTRRNFIGAGAAFAALAGRGLAAAQIAGLAAGPRRLRIGIVSDIHVTNEETARKFQLALEHFRSSNNTPAFRYFAFASSSRSR